MKPGTKIIIAGGVLTFIGALVVPLMLVLPLFGIDTGHTRFQVPGSTRVEVKTPGRYYLWNDYQTIFEGKSYNRSQSLPDGLVIRIFRAENGRRLEFVTKTNISSSSGSRAKNTIGYIELAQPGTVAIEVSGKGEERVFSFSRSIIKTVLMRIFGGGAVAVTGGLLGLALILWGIVRRSQAGAISPQPPATDGDQQARTWAMLCHLSALAGLTGIPFGNILGPLIVWLIKKDHFSLVDIQGRESLNFQISMTIYTILAVFLCFVLLGFVLLPALIIANIVLVVMASLKTNSGEAYHYPLTIRLIRHPVFSIT